ncbi:hypothetical protein UM89_21335 [Bacillus subtilis]|nr:hypothetical protein UM89_21335 [Bacillus subtilis]
MNTRQRRRWSRSRSSLSAQTNRRLAAIIVKLKLFKEFMTFGINPEIVCAQKPEVLSAAFFSRNIQLAEVFSAVL